MIDLLPQRVQHKIAVQPSGCWLWTGARTSTGYGHLMVGSRTDGSRRYVKAHRFVYEQLVGPIPDGLDLDHRCRTPLCVFPKHLDPVPPPPPDAGATMLGAYRGDQWRRNVDLRLGRLMHLNLRNEVLWWHCPVHPDRDERVRLPKARALVTPNVSLRTLIRATADGQTVDWQANAYGDFQVLA